MSTALLRLGCSWAFCILYGCTLDVVLRDDGPPAESAAASDGVVNSPAMADQSNAWGMGRPFIPVSKRGPEGAPVSPRGAPLPSSGATVEPPDPPMPPSIQSSPPAKICNDRAVARSRPCSDDPDPCGLHSGFAGDEYCLVPAPPGAGIQVHFGPKSYANAADLTDYIVEVGADVQGSMLAHVPLTSMAVYDHIEVSIRPAVDTWIAQILPLRGREAFYRDSMTCGSNTSINGYFAGGQNVIYESPPHGISAPENEGVSSPLSANSSACLSIHSYNTTAQPRLREAWVNFWFMDPSKLPQSAGSIGLVGSFGLNLAPGQKTVIRYPAKFTAPGRIISLFGNRHSRTRRLAAWLNGTLVYDSNRWQEAVTFTYDSITTNPPPDPLEINDGAASGSLQFQAGDILELRCYIENSLDQTLRFSAARDDGELCSLWGRTVGGGVSGMF